MHTLVSGLGSLENLEPDNAGGLFISRSTTSTIDRIGPDLQSHTVVSSVSSPGGLRLRGDTLWFVTGDASASGALGRADGTLETIDLTRGHRHVVASGLVMPNGLALDGRGHAFTSRDVGPGLGIGHGSGLATKHGLSTGVTRTTLHLGPGGTSGRVTPGWAAIDDTNGLAIDPSGQWLYADQTFSFDSSVYRIRLSDPARVEHVASLGSIVAGVPKGLDDITIDNNGALYLAANSAGQVIRLDPANGRSCVIARGMRQTSAVKIGRAFGAATTRLYVVGFDGAVREIVPPSAVALAAGALQ